MEVIDGGLAVDDRGKVTFCNDFDFKGVKRFYLVENHQKGFVRAWHGHKKESKYVLVTKGAAIVATVEMGKNQVCNRVVLSADKPQVFYIPAGYYNGFKTLTDDTQVMFFSTVTMEEAKDDDYRQPVSYWSDVFNVEER